MGAPLLLLQAYAPDYIVDLEAYICKETLQE
jgi:hypothetical protein